MQFNNVLFCFKDMAKENKIQEFRLNNIDETRNCGIEEINLNEMISKMHKNVCTNLNFISYFSYYNYWMYFHFCFCFFSWYSYKNYYL